MFFGVHYRINCCSAMIVIVATTFIASIPLSLNLQKGSGPAIFVFRSFMPSKWGVQGRVHGKANMQIFFFSFYLFCGFHWQLIEEMYCRKLNLMINRLIVNITVKIELVRMCFSCVVSNLDVNCNWIKCSAQNVKYKTSFLSS